MRNPGLHQASESRVERAGEQTIVGVNKYQVEGEQTEIPTTGHESVCAHQLERLEKRV